MAEYGTFDSCQCRPRIIARKNRIHSSCEPSLSLADALANVLACFFLIGFGDCLQ